MTRTECDQCRKLGDYPAPAGWVFTAQQPEPCQEEGGGFMAIAYSHGAEIAGTFCSWGCVADYATARALIPAEDPQGSTP